MLSPQEVLAVFRDSGGSDMDYLQAHLPRFLNTYQRFNSTWDRNRGVHMLDIGAHWLHQALVFRLGGYAVTAADVPVTLELESVRNLASRHGIELLRYTDLSAAGCLAALADDSQNVILMAEIIEHITFNPVQMWKEVYRVLAPGGRLIVTTPNYYWAGGRAWDWKRFLTGFGGGIATTEILRIHTMGHHWKEFSLRELQHYFCLLSADFNCVKSDYTSDAGDKTSVWQRHMPWLRQGVHLEVEVAAKNLGIVVQPGW